MLQDGIFHDNIILQLEIASPHFKSKKSVETFEVFVMRHKVMLLPCMPPMRIITYVSSRRMVLGVLQSMSSQLWTKMQLNRFGFKRFSFSPYMCS